MRENLATVVNLHNIVNFKERKSRLCCKKIFFVLATYSQKNNKQLLNAKKENKNIFKLINGIRFNFFLTK